MENNTSSNQIDLILSSGALKRKLDMLDALNAHNNNNNNNNNSSLFNSSLNSSQQLQLDQQMDSIEANKGYTFEEQFKQLYELSDDPKRKEFLDDLFQFMADRNQPVNRIPIMAKHVLDLYELYNLVVERGGLVEVINKKIWREITKGLNLPSSITSAAFTLRTQYMKYLYPYECAKKNFSRQDELQQAIDGNRREGRRSGTTGSLVGGNGGGGGGGQFGSAAFGAAGLVGDAGPIGTGGSYSGSPSPTHHLFPNVTSQHQQLINQHLSSLSQQQQQQQQAAAVAAVTAALQLHQQQQQQANQNQTNRGQVDSSSASSLRNNNNHHHHNQRSTQSPSSSQASPSYLHHQQQQHHQQQHHQQQQQQRLYQGKFSSLIYI